MILGVGNDGFTISGALGIVLAILGVVGIVGLVYGYFRVSLTKTTIDNYRGANDSLEARVKALEGDVASAKEHEQRCEAALEAQKQVNNLLADRVEGVSAVKELREGLGGKLDQLVERLDGMLEGQDHVAEAIGGLVVDLRRKFDLEDMDRRGH